MKTVQDYLNEIGTGVLLTAEEETVLLPQAANGNEELLKHSKRCGGFATMHSHDTHSTHLLHTIAVVAQ